MENTTPKGEDVITERTNEDILAIGKERGIEGLASAMKSIERGEDFAPIVISRQKGQIIAQRAEIKNGMFVLPDLHKPSKMSLYWKRRRVKNIMKNISPVLKKDIGEVTETALLRKTDQQLKDLENALKNKKKARLQNRVGCIFLEIGDESVQI